MKMFKLISGLALMTMITGALTLQGMTPKKHHGTSQEADIVLAGEDNVIVPNTVDPQDRPGVKKYGEDSIACVQNLSMYIEFYKQGNIPSAIPGWRWVFLNCPLASQNMYIHGTTIVKYLYSLETDPVRKSAYIDTLLLVHDQRITSFGHTPTSRKGMVLGRKAVDMMEFRPERYADIFPVVKESVELEAENSSADVLVVYMQNAIRMVEDGGASAEEVVLAFDRSMAAIDYQIKNGSKNADLYSKAQGIVESLFQPYATCDVLVGIYQARFDATPEDIAVLENITSMLDKAKCTDTKLFFNATQNLHRLKPTAQSAFLMGALESNAKNFNKSCEYFQQAADLFEDPNDKFNAYLRLADIQFRELRSYSQARANAYKAAEQKPNDGRPYMLIGDMYAASAKSCGSGDNVSDKAAIWAAVDKYQYAKRIDPSPAIENAANQSINAWSGHFPSTEDLFFYGFKNGDPYRVECWINENTTVRAR